MAAVDVRRLSVDRGGRQVLRDISLTVARGSVTGLLGPSGCGKTTLMRAIVGVQIVAGGEIVVLGLPAGSAHLRPRIGYVTQAPAVYLDLTVAENLDYFARVAGADADEVQRVLAAVDLRGREHELARRLSGGELTRVSLASALLGGPELLVLDEPTVGLDPVLRARLWSDFRALAAAGRTLLISSHVMEEADECDQLLLMRDGVVLARTTPADLRAMTGEQDLGRAFLSIVERS